MLFFNANQSLTKLIFQFAVVFVAFVFALDCKGSEAKLFLTELPVKPTMPALILPDQMGIPVDIQQLDDSVVVVKFWATWCRSCVKEMRTMNRVAKKYCREPTPSIAYVVIGGTLSGCRSMTIPG